MFINAVRTRAGRLCRVAVAVALLFLTSAVCAGPALATVIGRLPVNTALPTLSITPADAPGIVPADELRTTPGSWTNSPVVYLYQWYDSDSSGNNCQAIAGADAQSYTVQASDVGYTIRAGVFAWNAYGFGSAFSAPTSVIVGAGSNWG